MGTHYSKFNFVGAPMKKTKFHYITPTVIFYPLLSGVFVIPITTIQRKGTSI